MKKMGTGFRSRRKESFKRITKEKKVMKYGLSEGDSKTGSFEEVEALRGVETGLKYLPTVI